VAEGRDLVPRAVAVIDSLDHLEPLPDERVVTSTSPSAVDGRIAGGADPVPVLVAPVPLHWPELADVPGEPPRGQWERKLVLALVSADVIALACAVTLSWLARYRFTNENLAFWGYRFPYGVLALVALPLWLCGLVIRGSYDRSIIGSSPTEYSRVAGVVMGLLMLVCALSFVGSVPVSRGLIAVFFPALLAFSLLGRYGVRKRLHRRRAKGNALRRVVLVGDRAAVSNLTTHLRRSPHAGYEVVGAYVPGGSSVVFDDLDLEVLGEPDQLVSDISQQEIDAVAVSGHDLFQNESLRSLAWKLHGTGIQLLMAPDMAEIAGPRIVSRPAGGLPMLLVEEPRTGGPAQFVKALTERGAAAVALFVLSPLLAAIAAAVKLTSPGPVLFRQTRVARDGNEFAMLKFRSMVDGADEQVDELTEQNDHDGVLFKIREDPRVTRVGRFMRRYSLDELPQLWNVVRGDMSIVGPRPPLPTEVSQYGGDVGRRLMVKPGITGLWQVSGRSDLSWDESVRLDLYYVENWSLTLDLVIVGKTVKAVLAGSGAY